MIHYLHHTKINKKKWDDTIQSSPYRNAYAMSWYLDVTSPNWDALIQGDYEMMMPVTQKQKWGVKYVFQPYFSRQLGIFSPNPVTEETINNFLNELVKKFRLIEINLNPGNQLVSFKTNFEIKECQKLSLNKPYASLLAGYRRNHKRNINHAKGKGLRIERRLDPVLFIAHIKRCKAKYLNRKMHDIAVKIIDAIQGVGKSKIYGVYNSQDQLISTGLFIESKNAYYFILSSTTKEGEESKAMFYLVDQFIKEHAGQENILDFSGSSMSGVAHFNLGFGSESYEYPVIRINRLPKIINQTIKVFKSLDG